MKPKACLFIAAFWMSCAVYVDVAAQTVVAEPQYRFQHFDTMYGLPSDNVGSVAQDGLGFMWFQFSGGLTRFDGYNFKVYRYDPNDTLRSLPQGGIGFVLTDPKGNLWITAYTPNQYYPLAKYDRETDAFVKYRANVDGSIVSEITFDKFQPVIWFATNGKGLFSFNFETLKTKEYINDHPDSSMRATRNAMWTLSDRDSFLLVGGADGLWRFDKKAKSFSRPKCNLLDTVLLYHTPIWEIDDGPDNSYNEAWLGLNWKFVKVDKNLSVVRQFDFPNGIKPRDYVRGTDGIIWFRTWADQGIYRYNPVDNSFINIQNTPGDANSLKSNAVKWLKMDKDQNLWIATDQGVSRLEKQGLNFYNFTLPGKVDGSTLYRANDKDLVIVSQLVKKDNHEILIAQAFHDRLDSLRFETIATFERTNTVCGLWKGRNSFWISLYGHGIAGLPIDSKSGMILPGKPQLLRHDPKNKNTIASNFSTFVWEDIHENLWVGTRGSGLNRIILNIPYGRNGSVDRFQHVENDPMSLGNNIVWNLCPQDENSFWISTDTGVDLFKKDKFEHIIKDRNSPAVCKTSDSTLFIAVVGGLYEVKEHDSEYKVSQHPILKVADVIRIEDDKLGRLWISGPKGLVCYDRHLNVAMEFNEQDGINHTGAIQPWFREHLASSGIMVTHDPSGISLFDPSSLTIDTTKTFPVLTALKVNNQFTEIDEKGNSKAEFSTRRSICVLDQLVLDYQHNNFAIEFSAMEMTSPDKNLYRHMLEGYDNDWIETDWMERIATYTNLDAGEYIFKVRASNHHGVWSVQEATLAVLILPPPWKTWWAYTLYGIAIVGIFLSWRSYEIKRVKLKHRAEHLSELDNLKTRFFTNISHEFRTPITLIQGPLNEMYKGTFKGDQRSVIGVMLRNVQRLSKLINQLLDLSKLEARKMKLQASQVEVVQFLREITSSYESLAATKNIKYFFYPEVTELAVYIDAEKIEKVVHNLLSNAFKFTKEGGEIILYLKQDGKQCSVSVKDTGVGIPTDQLDRIFDRFHQVDSSKTREYEGSGLGMALAKELVELHHGTISVESVEGKGTTFTVRLLLGKDHLNKDEIIDLDTFKRSELVYEDLPAESTNEIENEKPVVPSEDHQPILLIVEDNADMRHYISKTFSDHYKVVVAANGNEGIRKAEEVIPDLIISDVMMPEMDGYKFCEHIKTKELTSHIPVILLTAKADRESKLTGLETGADDYLSKPFDADELKLIVRNRIEERRKLRERFSREITLEPKQISITSLDEKFLTKVLAIIEDHMDDETFSIDELSREGGYSNMHFYRKIKALAGQTPSQFLRTIRLKRAAELLSKNSDNVTQIAYSVGFNSVSYFNKCFKEQFGMTPGQFAERVEKAKT